jgi:ADP-ribose pyrophosphatase YjhB (NUDIX family)
MPLKLHHRLMQRGFLAFSRLSRGMTLGVRAMLVEGDRVLLVRHSYVPGWYFPGGGLEPGESFSDALRRELREEAGASLTGPERLFGLYRNAAADPRDHVALFVCEAFERDPAHRLPNAEILAADFFQLSALPADISPGTLARIREVHFGEAPSADW